jgi:hypothetical protein
MERWAAETCAFYTIQLRSIPLGACADSRGECASAASRPRSERKKSFAEESVAGVIRRGSVATYASVLIYDEGRAPQSLVENELIARRASGELEPVGKGVASFHVREHALR